MQYMPKLYDFLHYRIFDLESVSLAVQRFKLGNNQQNEENRALKSEEDYRYKRADEGVW